MTERFDRILGILLFLRSGRAISATELGRRFEVSTRTIHRDLKTLEAVGVPVYAERGRDGGFRLVEGYFLPPLTLARDEAIALLLGLAHLATSAGQALLCRTRHRRAQTPGSRPRADARRAGAHGGADRRALLPDDIFHPECSPHPPVTYPDSGLIIGQESATISAFLQAILDSVPVRLRYNSPYREGAEESVVTPLGVLWDRDRWYVAGQPDGAPRTQRVWRADRVTEISLLRPRLAGRAGLDAQDAFDVRELLGRRWLRDAMDHWWGQAPVVIRLSRAQADRLRRDWYYHHARFEQVDEDAVIMTLGEDNRTAVLELLRWLGPGADLVEPAEWRWAMREDLWRMLASYSREPGQP